jgi:hypothetical protein
MVSLEKVIIEPEAMYGDNVEIIEIQENSHLKYCLTVKLNSNIRKHVAAIQD